MNILDTITDKMLRFFFSLKQDDWIKWTAQDNDWKDDCDKFNGCFFIVKQMPKYPQHLGCQCKLKKISKPIPNVSANANLDLRKFTEYVFSNNYNDGKKELFEKWGYTIKDSEYLQQLYIEQALEKYCNGNYKLKGAGAFYPKIEIIIELPTRTGQTQKIKTGWTLYPEGKIKLSTPFTGFETKGDVYGQI